MGKKLKRININKLGKSLFSNKPLVYIIASVLLVVIFTNTSIQQYISDQSQAAGIGSGFPVEQGGEPIAPNWEMRRITDFPGEERVSDIYNDRLLFTGQDTLGYVNGMYVYDFSTEPGTVVSIPQSTPGDIQLPARIYGDNIVWAQSGNGFPGDWDIFMQTIGGDQINLTNNVQPEAFVDIYGDYLVYATSIGGNTSDYDKIYVHYLPSNTIVYTVNKQKFSIKGVRIYEDKIVWLEQLNTPEGVPSPEAAFVMELETPNFPIIELYSSDGTDSIISNFDFYGDVIVAELIQDYQDTSERNIFAYQLGSGLFAQITNSKYNQSPTIYKNKILYFHYEILTSQTAYLYDLLSKTKQTIFSVSSDDYQNMQLASLPSGITKVRNRYNAFIHIFSEDSTGELSINIYRLISQPKFGWSF